MAKFHKKQSKRMTCSQRYKIKKKIAQHQRTLRKQAKKQPKKPKPKDPGVPKSLPFKEEIIQEAQLLKQRAKEMRQLRKENQQETQSKNRKLSKVPSKLEKVFDEVKYFASKKDLLPYRDCKHIIETADVILEVLDARDPMGTRCFQIEKEVFDSESRKLLILVLNKIDLIPKINLLKWLTYLRQELPTVVFKASLNIECEELMLKAVDLNERVIFSRKCVGKNYLMKLLEEYHKNKGKEEPLKIGIVGFPNVGKFSVRNSLIGRFVPCSKNVISEITLKKYAVLLDKPAVISNNETCPSNLVLRGFVNNDILSNCIENAKILLDRGDKKCLMLNYCVQEFSSVEELLNMLARRFGEYKKGGALDLDAASQKLLQDWSNGKIKYYTIPPETHEVSNYVNQKNVTGLNLISKVSENSLLDEVPFPALSDCILIHSTGPVKAYNNVSEKISYNNTENTNEVNLDESSDVEFEEEYGDTADFDSC